MFQFFDQQQNPFAAMMNMENTENADSNEGVDMAALQLMQQAMMMQMQLMQMMCMMPMFMMQGMAAMLSRKSGDGETENAAPGQAGGFKLGNMELPPELLGALLKMDMSPENLEKLQKVLDFVFEAIPHRKDEKDEAAQG